MKEKLCFWILRGKCCTALLFQCKVISSLPVGTLPLCVIAVSRLSLCDVLLLLCPCMRSSIRKGTCLSSLRVSFYQSLHLCCLHASELHAIINKDRWMKKRKRRTHRKLYLPFTFSSDGYKHFNIWC